MTKLWGLPFSLQSLAGYSFQVGRNVGFETERPPCGKVARMTEVRKTKTGTSGGTSGVLRPVGYIRSQIKKREDAPRQGSEGAPDAWLEITKPAIPALQGLQPGDEVIVITWLHRARRNVLTVHPRGDRRNPLTGVFATRSPDRPNPLGLHQVTIREIHKDRLLIGPIEAIDGTPVADIKPALSCEPRR